MSKRSLRFKFLYLVRDAPAHMVLSRALVLFLCAIIWAESGWWKGEGVSESK